LRTGLGLRMPRTRFKATGECIWSLNLRTMLISEINSFTYTDERHQDGKMKGMALDGPAHGEFYAQLAKSTEVVPWHATFVKDMGYVAFE
jgi:hypothetical protein